MITIKPLKQSSSPGTWEYYQEKDNYYLSDKESMGQVARWYGQGAKALGLSETIDSSVYINLLDGKLPTGDELGKHENGRLVHRPGFDLQVAPPKSVSLLLLIGGDERLEQAVQASNNFILSRIEKDLAQARIRTKEALHYENTGKLVMAQHPHTTSRELDPLRHTHNIVFNVTQTADGKWRSLASANKVSSKNEGTFEQLYRDQKFYGLLHANDLASRVKKLGYQIRITDTHGNFDIVGIDQATLDYFSKRRQQITTLLKEKGLSSARAAEVAALDSRQLKQAINSGQLKQYWKDEIAKLDVNLDRVIQASKDRLNEDPTVKAPPKIQRDQISNRALHFAAWHLGEYATRMSHGDLVRQAFRFADGKLDYQAIELEIAHQFKTGELLGKAGQYYTTPALLAEEKALIKQIKASRGSSQSVPLPEERSANLADTLLASKDRVQVIQVNGFHQEKDLIQTLVTQTEAKRVPVQVLHVGKTQANQLQQAVQRSKAHYSLFDWIADFFSQKPDLVQTVAGFSFRREQALNGFLGQFNTQHDCILVHDAQKLSLAAFKKLDQLAEKGKSKLILLNNTQATTNFKAGHVMATVEQAGIQPVYHAIQRQQTPIELKVSAQPLQALAKHYVQLDEVEREQTTLVCTTNKQQNELVHLIRGHQQVKGQLGWQSTTFQVLSTQSLSDAEKSQARFYRPGDRLLVNGMDSRSRAVYRVVDPETTPEAAKPTDPTNLLVQDESGQVNVLDLTTPQTLWVNRASQLAIAEGEQLRLDKPWQAQPELEVGQVFTVKRVEADGLHVERAGQVFQWSREALQEATLNYAYTKKPSQLDQTEQVICTPLAAYQMNRQLLSELSDGQKQLQVFTLDEAKAKKQLTQSKLPWQASQVASGQPSLIYRDVQYADQTIRHDLEAVASALRGEAKGSVDTAVAYALAKLGEREAAFEHKALVMTAMTYALGEVSDHAIEAAFQAKAQAGQLLGKDSVWTSQGALALEQGIFEKIKAGQQVLTPIASPDQPLELPERLTQGQRNAVSLALTTADRFVSVQGLSGTGKTTMMRTLKEHALKAGFDVIGLAPTHVAVKKMDASLQLPNPSRRLKAAGIETVTIHRFVFDDSITFTAKTLFIVDEVSMLGSRLFSDLQNKLIQSGGRALLVGDKHQNPSVEAGKPVPLAQAAGVLPYVEMNEVMRQEDSGYKQAVLFAANKAITQSAEQLERLNPQDTIDRDVKGIESFPTTSFIEISQPKEPGETAVHDDKELSLATAIKEKHGIILDAADQATETPENKPSLYETMAKDYLTRTPEHRAKTLVVADTHEDRQILDTLIRAGLKEQGVVHGEELSSTRWVSKNLDQADLLHVKNFQAGDELHFARSFGGVNAGDHWTVLGVIPDRNELRCQNRESQIKMTFNPATLAIPAQMSALTPQTSPLALGDRLRLRQTNRESGWLANTEYTVKHIDQEKVTLLKEDGDLLVLDTQKDSDRHWDYAYTYTSMGVQGLDDRSVIFLALSWRVNATTHKTFYVDLSRGVSNVVIYTDNKAELIRRLSDPEKQKAAEKTSALEVLGLVESTDAQNQKAPDSLSALDQPTKQSSRTEEEAYFSASNSERLKPVNDRDQQSRSSVAITPREPKLDAKAISHALAQQTERLAITLLGEPNNKLSGRGQLRYGSKGSLAINLETGLWFNHETGEKGNLLALIRLEQGLSDFKAVLRYASGFLGHGSLPDPVHRPQLSHVKEKSSKSTTQDYAQLLYRVSKPIKGTLAEEYLNDHRKVHHTQQADLRFLPWINSQPAKGESKFKTPALLAFAKDEQGAIHHVQVIKLDRQTAQKDTRSAVAKQTYGPSKGYGIELNHAAERSITYLAEGIETGLSLVEANKKAHVLAVLGKSNFANIHLDQLADKVVLCLDHDGVQTYTNQLIEKAVARLEAAGKTVAVLLPDAQNIAHRGDFNDLLREKGLAEVIKQMQQPLPLKTLQAILTPEKEQAHYQRIIRAEEKWLANQAKRLANEKRPSAPKPPRLPKEPPLTRPKPPTYQPERIPTEAYHRENRRLTALAKRLQREEQEQTLASPQQASKTRGREIGER